MPFLICHSTDEHFPTKLTKTKDFKKTLFQFSFVTYVAFVVFKFK